EDGITGCGPFKGSAYAVFCGTACRKFPDPAFLARSLISTTLISAVSAQTGDMKGMPSSSMLIEQTTCETWATPGGRQVQGLARGSSPLHIAIYDYRITRNN